MTLRRFLTSIIFILLATAGMAKATDSYLLSGDADLLWLVKLDEKNKTFQLMTKSSNQPWKWMTSQPRQGMPTTVTSVGTQIYLLLPRGEGSLIFSYPAGNMLQGEEVNDPRWPTGTAPIAACAARNAIPKHPGGIVVVVPRHMPTTTPATAPAGVNAPSITIFHKDSSGWTFLANGPKLTLTDSTRVFVTAGKGQLFLLARNIGGPLQLWSLTDGKWKALKLKGMPAGMPVGFSVLKNKLLMVLARYDKDADVSLVWTTPTGGKVAKQPITVDNKPLALTPEETLMATRLGERIALIWSGEKTLNFGTCDLNGKIAAAQPIELLGKSPTEDKRAQEILQYFVLGVVVAIFLAMFVIRPRATSVPFILPPPVRPGNLFRRVIAAAIDFLPWSFAAVFVFMRPLINSQEAANLLQNRIQHFQSGQFVPTLPEVYTIIATFVLYVVYCILMERYRGATIGKQLMRLRVVGDGVTPPGWREVLLRNLTKIVEMTWPLIILLVVVPIFSRNRQRLGDIFARTAVVNANTLVPPEKHEADPVEATHDVGPGDGSDDADDQA